MPCTIQQKRIGGQNEWKWSQSVERNKKNKVSKRTKPNKKKMECRNAHVQLNLNEIQLSVFSPSINKSTILLLFSLWLTYYISMYVVVHIRTVYFFRFFLIFVCSFFHGLCVCVKSAELVHSTEAWYKQTKKSKYISTRADPIQQVTHTIANIILLL